MRKRILSTFGLWALIIGCIHFFGTLGGVWLVALVAVLTQREFYQMVRRMGLEPFDKVGMVLGALVMLAPYYAGNFIPTAPELAAPGTVLAAAVVVFALRILGERQPHNRVETLAWSLFGVLYVAFMLSFLVRIMVLPGPDARSGLLLTIWLIAVSKFCDVGALLAGMAFGRHKMAPGISPKKTWEGAVGGVLISGGVGAALAHFLAEYYPANFTPVTAGLIALPIAALAIVSDLVESVIKRRADTKDAGQTIPGIGGMFDLSDSLILTAPMGYIAFALLHSTS
jgi:phosphatidate cytidylyltransferase